jgi:hypothetical protein
MAQKQRKYYFQELICVSDEYWSGNHHSSMISQRYCIEKAEMCALQAALCAGSALEVDWLVMAMHWRDLAGDSSDQATTARLMQSARLAR